jgi:hypothetical protein
MGLTIEQQRDKIRAARPIVKTKNCIKRYRGYSIK